MKQSSSFRRNLARKLRFTSRSATSHSKHSYRRRPTFEMLEARQMLAGHPTDLALVGDSVLENSANGTVVGTVTASDPNPGETFNYVLPNDAVGRFAINTQSGQITVANGELIDFEAATSLPINVKVTDSTGNTYNESFTINVTDVVGEGPVTPFDPANDTGRLAAADGAIDWVALVDAAVAAGGNIILVSSATQLNAAMNSVGPTAAQPGDIVVIAAGTYGNNLNFRANGTEANPIIVVPAGMLNGTDSFGNRSVNLVARTTITGSNIIVGGFWVNNPVNLAGHSIFFNGATNVRLTDIEVRDSGNSNVQAMIEVQKSESITIDRNYFTNNNQPALQLMSGTASSPSSNYNTVIEYNTFDDQKIPITTATGFQARQFNSGTRIHYNQLIGGSDSISTKTSNVHMFRNYLKDSGALRLRGGNNSSIIGNYIENSKSNGIYLAAGNQVVTNNVIVNPNRNGSSSSAGITLKYGYPTETEALVNGRRWALNNSLIANNTIVGVRRNGILARYNGQPNSGNPNDREFAIPYDNVIVNNTVVSDNNPGTNFLGAYRFGIADTGDTDPNTGIFYPAYTFGDFTTTKAANPGNSASIARANLKRGNNVVANNQAYLTDGVGVVTAGISSAGFLAGNPLFDGSGFRPTSASMLINAGQYVERRSEVDDSVVWSTSSTTDYDGKLRTMGVAPDIGAIEFIISGGENSAPTNMLLSGGSVAENSANGTVVGLITTEDPDAGEIFTYALTNNAGGRFAINASTGQITVADGTLLDFESNEDHAITVRVTDSASNTFSEGFTINVTDVAEGGQAGTLLLTDTFIGSGELVVHSPDSNTGSGIWTTSAGTGRVQLADNQLRIRYDSGYSAAIDVGVTDQKVVVDVTLGGGTRKPLIMINREAVTSGGGNDLLTEGESYAAQLDIGSNVVNLLQLASNGSSTLLASASLSMDANSLYTVEVSRLGNSLTISIDGTSLISHTLTGTPLSNTWIALGWDLNTSLGRFDNLTVSELSAEVDSADFDNDSDVDGSDFLAWQRGYGTPNANLADGDANGDQNVDGADLGIWQSAFGQNASQSALSAGAALQSASATESFVTDSEETEPAAEKGPSILAVAPELTEATTANLDVQVLGLGGNLLGVAFANTSTIVIDPNAAGRGRLVDQSPWDAFGLDERGTDNDANRVDLLSVFTHEMGEIFAVDQETSGTHEWQVDFALAMMLEDDDDFVFVG